MVTITEEILSFLLRVVRCPRGATLSGMWPVFSYHSDFHSSWDLMLIGVAAECDSLVLFTTCPPRDHSGRCWKAFLEEYSGDKAYPHIWIPWLRELERVGAAGSCPLQFIGQFLPAEFWEQGS